MSTEDQQSIENSVLESSDDIQEPGSQVQQSETENSVLESSDNIQEPGSQVQQSETENSVLESSDDIQEPGSQGHRMHYYPGMVYDGPSSSQPYYPQQLVYNRPYLPMPQYYLTEPYTQAQYSPPAYPVYQTSPYHTGHRIYYSRGMVYDGPSSSQPYYPQQLVYNRPYLPMPQYYSMEPYAQAQYSPPAYPVYQTCPYHTYMYQVVPQYYQRQPDNYQRHQDRNAAVGPKKNQSRKRRPISAQDQSVSVIPDESESSKQPPVPTEDQSTREVAIPSIEEVPLNNRASADEIHPCIDADDIQQTNEGANLSLEEVHLGDDSAPEDQEEPEVKLKYLINKEPELVEEPPLCVSDEEPEVKLKYLINKEPELVEEPPLCVSDEEPEVKLKYLINKEPELVEEPPLCVSDEQTEAEWTQPFKKEDLQLIDVKSPLHLKMYVDSDSAIVLRLRGDNPSITVRINTKGQLQVLWDVLVVTFDITWTTISILHNLVHIQAKILSATNVIIPAQSQFINLMADKILFGSYKEGEGEEYISENIYRLSNAGLGQTAPGHVPKMNGRVFCESNKVEDAICLGSLIKLKKLPTQEHWRLDHNINMIFTPSTGQIRFVKEGNSLIIKGSEVLFTTNLNTEEALMRTVIDSEKEEILIHNTFTRTKVIVKIPEETLEFTNELYCVTATGFKEPLFKISGFYS